jgi:hypothetical protein
MGIRIILQSLKDCVDTTAPKSQVFGQDFGAEPFKIMRWSIFSPTCSDSLEINSTGIRK